MTRPFEKIFGSSKELIILDALLPFDYYFTIHDLEEDTYLTRRQIKRTLKKFLKWNIIIQEKDEYRVNKESPYVILINELNIALIEDITKDTTEN